MFIKIIDACSCIFAVVFAPFSMHEKLNMLVSILIALYQQKTKIQYVNSVFTVDKPLSFLILLLYWQEIYVIKKNCQLSAKPTVIDIGANIGQWPRHFNFFFHDSEIFSFEPNKKIGTILSKNSQNIRGWHVFPFGIGSEKKTQLYIPKEGSAEGTLIKPTNYDFETVSVQCISLTKKNCEKLKIPMAVDLIKIDVEGYEEEILKHTSSLQTKYLEIEVDLADQTGRTIGHVQHWITTYWHASAIVVAVQKAHFLSTIGNAYFEISYAKKD